MSEERLGRIGAGLLVLVGVSAGDDAGDAESLARKVAGLRIFRDAEGNMNRDVVETGGAVMVISQFTLLGDVRKGRRPSFVAAARPEQAEPLYERVVAELRALGIETATGRFGARMDVELVNDGPVTILIDTADLGKPRAAGSM